MEKIITTGSGLTLCSRYAFMPNKLKYCGPSNERTLFDYAASDRVDKGLIELLEKFETMYPYLKLIAKANQIRDPFNKRVVEAYWLGNSLLDKVSMSDLYYDLKDKHHLLERLPKKYFSEIIYKIPLNVKPHHSFHVLNIFIRTGRDKIKHTLQTMQNCLITSGRIEKIDESKESVVVTADSLAFRNGKLTFAAEKRKVRFSFDNQKLIDDIVIGDLVSLHWNFVCDRLSLVQAKRLKDWNQYHLNLANLTI